MVRDNDNRLVILVHSITLAVEDMRSSKDIGGCIGANDGPIKLSIYVNVALGPPYTYYRISCNLNT